MPEVWAFQVTPPLIVATIVPAPPTTKQVLLLGQLMLLKLRRGGETWLAQVAPPSVVARIVPPAPEAKQVLVLGQLMPWRVLPHKR